MKTPVPGMSPDADAGAGLQLGLTASVLGLGLITAALGWAYRSSFEALLEQWSSDPNYSHGYFVIPIAVAIAWTRRTLIDPARIRPQLWGLVPLLGVLAVRAMLYQVNEQYVETMTVPLVVGCAVLILGGWHAFWTFLPAVLFLYLMMPLPPSFNNMLSSPLQRVATVGSITILQMIGMPAVAEGNVIIIGAERLEVARACNGLSMLLSFVTLITAMVVLVRRPMWERMVLLLSTVPIALVSNILRITATAWCYHQFGHEAGEKIAHDWAGYLMMPTALVLVLLEMQVMSWLVVEVELPTQGTLVAGRT